MEFECTEKEFKKFEETVRQNNLFCSLAFSLELMLLGLKPGTKISDRDKLECCKQNLSGLFHFKKVELDFEELPDSTDELEKTPYFIARNKDRFRVLKERYWEKDSYRRDFGKFVGYPKEDIDWFVEGKQGQYEKSREKLGGPEDFDFVVSAVMYIPKPTEKAYNRAENTANKYIEAIREADKKFDSDIGEKLIEVQVGR